jgi:hypothetical protein
MPADFRGLIEPGHLRDQHPAVQVVYPKSAARDQDAAIDELINAFPDHEPVPVLETDDAWHFRLAWTSDPLFVDPGVSQAAERLYGLSWPGIGGYREVHRWGGRDVVFSMVHAWALLAGSMAVNRRGGRPLGHIVHVDDHTDLGPSMLQPLPEAGMLRDEVFDSEIILADPDSVVAAIRRGAVNKGNFLTAHLLGYPASVVYVGERLHEGEFHVVGETEAATLGGRSFARARFRLDPAGPAEGTFRQTRVLPDVAAADGAGVWLDVDLDYFSNRYNGDSDNFSAVPEPGEHELVMRHVGRFLEELSSVNWLAEIEAVSIAISPGFFPADHWADVIPAVRDGIRRILES